MRLLANENFPLPAAEAVRQAGHSNLDPSRRPQA